MGYNLNRQRIPTHLSVVWHCCLLSKREREIRRRRFREEEVVDCGVGSEFGGNNLGLVESDLHALVSILYLFYLHTLGFGLGRFIYLFLV